MRRGDLPSKGLVPAGRARDVVMRVVDQLLRAGAVDAATRPLDRYIDDLLTGWLARLRPEPEPPRPTPPAGDPGPHRKEAEPSEPEDVPDPHIGLRILTALAFVADGANFTVALAVVGNSAPTTTLIVVAGLAGIALSLAHGLGTALRDRVEGWGRAPLPLLVAMGTLIVAIGGIAASIRLAVPTSTVGTTAFGEPDPAADAQAALVNQLLTLLLLILYLASTLMAGYVAFATRRSPAARRRRVGFAERCARGWTSVRRRRELGRRERERRRIRERDIAAAEYRALAGQLRREVNLRIATHLGEPSATDALTTAEDRVTA